MQHLGLLSHGECGVLRGSCALLPPQPASVRHGQRALPAQALASEDMGAILFVLTSRDTSTK